jgi:hypothetical protein
METGFDFAEKAVAAAATFVTTSTTSTTRPRGRGRHRSRCYFSRGLGRRRPRWGLFVTSEKRRRAD